MILGKFKKYSRDFLVKEVNDAVVTVPAYFNNPQRQATKDTGRIAGLIGLRIINETSAATIAYGLDNRNQINNKQIFLFLIWEVELLMLVF